MRIIFEGIEKFLAEKSQKQKLICVIGPTASGKTGVAVSIAEKCNGEIINADSRQMYAHMSIGTAAPTEEEKRGIVHHLFEFLEPSEECNVSHWKQLATEKIEEIGKKGCVPILCGGTGLFVNALTKNFSLPKVAPQEAFRAEKELLSSEELWKELEEKDPEEAEKIPPPNKRYIIRALEIYEVTGKKKSELFSTGEDPYDTHFIGVTQEREKIYERIEKRVEEMKTAGFLEEVKNLMEKGFQISDPGMNAHGYPEAIAFLQNEISEEELWETMKKNTRHYAKRQLTWWRRDERVNWHHSRTQEKVDIS